MNKILNERISNLSKDQLREATKYLKDDLLQKGVSPYDYIDYFQRYKETEFPSKDKFSSKMTGDKIKDEEYKTGLIDYKILQNTRRVV